MPGTPTRRSIESAMIESALIKSTMGDPAGGTESC